jgi:peptide/nickel transport system permease protein
VLAQNARRRWWRTELFRSAQSLIGLTCIGLLALLALTAPLITLHPPDAMQLDATFQTPSGQAIFGTDELGRDVFSRIVYGGRVSLQVAAIAVGMSLVVGVPLGLLAGFYGGVIDSVIMRLMDALLAFPAILLAIAIAAALGPGLTNAMIAIGIVSFPGFARIARGQTLALKSVEYVQAARALGLSDARIIARHILPNGLAPIIIAAATTSAAAILTEAALSFVGLGAVPPTPSWGSMLQNGYPLLEQAPWLSLFPGLAIAITTLGFNFLGDGLRDVLDPKLRGR